MGNSCPDFGGGILFQNSSPSLDNVTITDNSATFKGGGIYCYESSPNITNTIVANNLNNFGIYVESGNPTITYSDFYNNENGNFYNCGDWIGVNVTTNSNGDDCDLYYNIQLDPLFVDANNDNYHLQSNSPCIGAGDPDTDISEFQTDFDGNYRIRDAVIDMGSYEYQSGGITIQNTIEVNNTEARQFTDAGTELQFTGTHVETIINATKYAGNPGIVGNLPTGVEHIASDRYWNLHSTEGNVGNYNVTFDLTGVAGIQNFNTLHILKRNNSSSSWQDVVSDLGLTLTYNNPYITVNNLTAFSDFVPAGGSDNTLPLVLNSFTVIYTIDNENDYVSIDWSTASENDINGFNVYRSENDEFSYAEKVNNELIPGTNTTQTHEYNYFDEEILLQNIQAGDEFWYWLEIVEFSGISNVHNESAHLIIPDEYEPELPPELPIIYGLYQNFPNPFNPSILNTKICFNLTKSSNVRIDIYNLKGQLASNLYNGYVEFEESSNPKVVSWNGRNENGIMQESGIYFYKMSLNGVDKEVKKLLLIR